MLNQITLRYILTVKRVSIFTAEIYQNLLIIRILAL